MAKRRPIAEMNVVPYIDVMLVLLVIFMITAPILTQGVKVDLPKVASEPIKTPKNELPIIVSIRATGDYVIERGRDEDQAANLEYVQRYVSKILKQQPQTQVLVRGDQSVAYGKVVSLMTTLQAAGAESVGLVTEAPEPGA
ncbi:protein TolR [Bermanella marisrubri]|uniref:Tol-Pal system protein TolR n=1 Tax=Bermanella marisrubri TaxID=207949 RepID=Q1N0T4_9GAMM|nr:protein TolR [Bermanella marisrubri]EAT11749.1 TolR protein [Oceanobacter sp. RED65] [Bermanella marisrubri]QIZ83785.1 protein TolR [Bermanella marisrubri]